LKVFKIVGAIFSLIGVAALIGAIISIFTTKEFIANSILTKGEIIEIVTKKSTDSDGHTSYSDYPVIRFKDQKNNSIEFQSSSSVSSNISVGQISDVRYLPEDPNNAKMANSFMDMWFLPVLLGIFGVVFTGLGIPFFWLGIKDQINEKKSLTYSKVIEVPIKSVSQNRSITVNGRSPFQIEAQWLNPDTNEIHIFKSKNFWYDPSDYLNKETILVKADPMNLKKYWMDVSSLPKKV
jgi:hypothetical protein